jgi:phosphatidate cytidylyltransferase
MVLAVLAVLLVDPWLAPHYPCLLISLTLLAALCGAELHALAADAPRPPRWAMMAFPALLLASGWLPHLFQAADPWQWIGSVLVVLFLGAFGVEMWAYTGAKGVVPRLALLLFSTVYVGLLASYLAQIRWWPDDSLKGSFALALAIFVPKCGDMAAYGVGRILGRTRMTPLLSPKKTIEGLIGGLAASVLVAVLIQRGYPIFSHDLFAVAFGLSVGIAGVVGDLAESLIKRDFGRKDASGAVPGFGGLLDIVDSVLFAAPVAYWWLK